MIGLFMIAASVAPPPVTSRIAVGYDFVCDAIGEGRKLKAMRGHIDVAYEASNRTYQTRLTMSPGPDGIPGVASIEAYAAGSGVSASLWEGAKARYLFAVNVPADQTVRNGSFTVMRELMGDPNMTATAAVGICSMTKRGDF